jgi:hypothetical protein
MSTYTQDDISKALNRAADDIIEWADLPDRGVRDALNLLVNVTGSYLWGEAETVADAIDEGYDTSPEEVRDWIG